MPRGRPDKPAVGTNTPHGSTLNGSAVGAIRTVIPANEVRCFEERLYNPVRQRMSAPLRFAIIIGQNGRPRR